MAKFFSFFFLFLILGDPGVGQPAPPLPERTLRGRGGEGSEGGWAVRLRAVIAAPPPPPPEYLSLEPPGRERATLGRMAGGGAGRACAGPRGAGAECARRSAGLAPRGARGGRGRPRWACHRRACAYARARGGVADAAGGGASGGAARGGGRNSCCEHFLPQQSPRRTPAARAGTPRLHCPRADE